MLIIQHNCKQKYKNTVIILENAISVEARIVIILELFIGS